MPRQSGFFIHPLTTEFAALGYHQIQLSPAEQFVPSSGTNVHEFVLAVSTACRSTSALLAAKLCNFGLLNKMMTMICKSLSHKCVQSLEY